MGEPRAAYLSDAVVLLAWQFVFFAALPCGKTRTGLRTCERFPRCLHVCNVAGAEAAARMNAEASLVLGASVITREL